MHDGVTAWEIWRVCNLALAGSALALNAIKMAQTRVYREMSPDALMGLLACLMWPLCYVPATVYAWSQGNEPGPWTAIMSVPILWTNIAGLMRSDPR